MITNKALLRRQGAWHTVSIEVAVRSDQGRTTHGRLLNLSARGCTLELGAGGFERGAWVLIRLPGLEGLDGSVRWSRNGRTGVRFERPLHVAVLEHLAAANAEHLHSHGVR